MKTTPDPRVLLVDSHHGIYCYKVLAESYKLFTEDGLPLDAESLDGLKGDEWCDYIDWIGDIYTEALDGKMHRIESIEGDVWAVHPDANWCDHMDAYVITCECDSAHCPAND